MTLSRATRRRSATGWPRTDAFASSASSSTTAVPDAAPPARHLLDHLGQHLDVLELELAAHAVVVEGPGATGGGHVEAGQVAAAGAAVPGDGHPAMVPARRPGPRRSLTRRTICSLHRTDACPTHLSTCSTPRRRPAQLRRPGPPAVRRHLLRDRPRDHRRLGPRRCGITEVGAVKVRGGECLGTFQTLVNPGAAIPPEITVLTGITQAMVVPAPRIETVLPSLLEFVGDAVVVGHNVRFDLGFLRAALERAGRPPLANPSIDTCALARRLVRDEVPELQAGHARRAASASTTSPATGPSTTRWPPPTCCTCCSSGRPGWASPASTTCSPCPPWPVTPRPPSSALTSRAAPRARRLPLPRPGRAGALRGQGHQPAQRGCARTSRATPAARWASCCARRTPSTTRCCSSTLEAAVVEVRLIHEHQPRFNRQAKDWSRYPYLKLTLGEAFPRLSVVRTVRDDGALYLGPLTSTRAGPAGGRGHRDRRAPAPLHGHPGQACPARVRARRPSSAWPPCPCAGTISPPAVPRRGRPGGVGLAPRPDAAARAARAAHASPGRRAALRGGGRRARAGRRRSPRPCAASASSTACRAPGGW